MVKETTTLKAEGNMTLIEMIKLTGEIPKKFEINGKTFELISGVMADGSNSLSNSLMIWEMKEGKKFKLRFVTYGENEKEAKENMKNLLLR